MQAVLCGDNCKCHYNITERANVLTCSGPPYTALPRTVPNFTNWIEYVNSDITELCWIYDYLKKPSNMTHINLSSGKIEVICDETLNEILYNSEVRVLNLINNRLKKIPEKLRETAILENSTKLDKLLLAGNPVQCDCDMLWLISWFNNTRVSGKRLVQDYQDVICTGGEFDGTPVYKLDKVKMGCYPKKVAAWIIVVSSVIGCLFLISVIIAIMIHRKWNAVRWIIFKNFDKLLGDPDRNEDHENIEFDAFLSYW